MESTLEIRSVYAFLAVKRRPDLHRIFSVETISADSLLSPELSLSAHPLVLSRLDLPGMAVVGACGGGGAREGGRNKRRG